jgi:hypothetical protein
VADLIVGIDFAGPAKARDQRRKILAVAAKRTGDCRFVVSPGGLNARLLGALPGWTAEELSDALLSLRPVPAIVAADFPFCVPRELLALRSFAAAVGRSITFTIDAKVRTACEAYDTGGRTADDHDGADAIVAACVAALYREGRAREIVGTPAEAREVEGAIWSF